MTKDELRERFPQTAAIVDEYRAVFGPGVKVKWIKEAGVEMGRKGPEGVPLSAPAPTRRTASSKRPSQRG
jgi:hypothetical protein